MNWYISNFPLLLLKGNKTFIFRNENIKNIDNKTIPLIIIEGYILPRVNDYEKYKGYNQNELISILYKRYKNDFIKYIKGIFTIIIIDNDDFYVFTDRYSIKKVFVYREKSYFYITNNFDELSKFVKLKIDKENAAIFILFSHFLPGQTLFKNVVTLKPASYLHYSNGELNEYQYWTPKLLLDNRKVENINFSDYASKWRKIIQNYINYLNPKSVSITITAGNDSRMVLAAILNMGIKLFSFSYGNPNSFDVLIPKRIADKTGIKYFNHFVSNPSKIWLERNIFEMLNYGNTYINLHRAHRNDAAREQKIKYPDIEMVLTGLVGGEYIKEPNYNDIVIPKMFFELEDTKEEDAISYIKDKLNQRLVNTNNVDSSLVYTRIKDFLSITDNYNDLERKFLYTYYFYGAMHHSQDSTVFSQHLKHVVNPFMDIDFLEMLSVSKYWYVNKNKSKFIDKLFHSYLSVKITDILAPELSDIPYYKRGKYTASDLLRSRFLYIVKRFFNIVFKEKSIQNFEMGKWLYDYCDSELNTFHPIMDEILINNYNIVLNKIKDSRIEKSWHVITNPINISINIKKYV